MCQCKIYALTDPKIQGSVLRSNTICSGLAVYQQSCFCLLLLSSKLLSMKNLSTKNLSMKNLSSMFLLSVRAVYSTMSVCVLLLGTGHHGPKMVNTACVVCSIGNGCSDSIRVSSIRYWGSGSIDHWGNSRLNVDIGLCSNLFMDIGFGFYFLMHIW